MKIAITTLIVSLLLLSIGGPMGYVEDEVAISPAPPPPSPASHDLASGDAVATLTSTSGSFLENRGQLDNGDVLFYVSDQPLSVGLRNDGATYTLVTEDEARAGPSGTPPGQRMTVFSMHLDGCNEVEPRGMHPLGYPSHFYLGNDPSRWVRGARSFEEVVYRDIYDHIDLRFYFKEGMLKYEFILGAGAEVRDIIMRYDGIERLSMDMCSGDLLIETDIGVVRDIAPVAISSADGYDSIHVSFELTDDRSCGFSMDDPPAQCYPIVIDPGLVASSYLGGSHNDECNMEIALDNGSYIIGGSTQSTNFKGFPKGYVNKGQTDLVIVIINHNLTKIIASLAVGGSRSDMYNDIAMVSSTECVLTGMTNSSDFPVTTDAVQSYLRGGADGFMFHVDIRTMEVLYSTYFGGRDKDAMVTVQPIEDDDLIICGITNSEDIPTTAGAFCETYIRTHGEEPQYMDSGFIGRYNRTSENFTWMTYVNGLALEINFTWGYSAFNLDIHPNGTIYVVGTTNLTNMPTTKGAFREERQGQVDIFVMRLDSSDSSLMACTYLGGEGDDISNLVKVDPRTGVYVVGSTLSRMFYTTLDAYQRQNRGSWDKYVTLLDFNLSVPIYSTYIGGFNVESFNIFDIGPGPSQFSMVFRATGADLNTTHGCHKPFRSGSEDSYLCIIDMKADEQLVYGTYIGGNGYEVPGIYDGLIDSAGRFYFSVTTTSNNCYMTDGAYQTSYMGGQDALLMTFEPTPCPAPGPPTGPVANPGDAVVNLTWSPPPFNGAIITRYRVIRVDEGNGSEETMTFDGAINELNDFDVVNGRTYTYRIQAQNSAGWGNFTFNVTARPLGYPSPPRDFNVETGDGNVTLTWSQPKDWGGGVPTGYWILKGASYVSATVFCGLLDPNQTSFIDWNVTVGTPVYYKLRAVNDGHNGSGARNWTTPARPPDAPRDLTATPGDGEVELTWKVPFEDGGAIILEYRIYRGTSPDDMHHLISLERTNTGYTVHSLFNGIEYWFYVVAVNEFGEGFTTPHVNATPRTVPTMPTNLMASPGDRSITLTWDPPVSDGGADVLGYHVYMKGPDDASFTRIARDVAIRQFVIPSLVNGLFYSFELSAVNLVGEGERSGTVDGVPMTTPTEPWKVTSDSIPRGVEFLWNTSNSTGGSEILRYWVYRGPSRTELEVVGNVTTEYFVDEEAQAGVTYYLAVCAENEMGNSTLSPMMEYRRKLVPAAPEIESVKAGDRFVELKWSTPHDGGSPIENYDIYRGTVAGDLAIYRQSETSTSFTDNEVVYGRKYYYYIIARNDVGPGPRSSMVNATPLQVPDRVISFVVKAKDEGALISWSPPLTDLTRSPVNGYVVYRGTSLENMAELTRLNPDTTSFLDYDVVEDVDYYYTVAADSDLGVGRTTPPVDFTLPRAEPSFQYFPYLLLFVVILVITSVVVYVTRRRKIPEEEAYEVPDIYAEDYASKGIGAPTAQAEEPRPVAAVTPPLERPAITQYIIEEVLVVYRDGRLITSCAREECGTEDADLMSGMLIAVQGLIQDGLEHGGKLESIKYGENLISLATGNHLVLAAVVYGRPDDDLTSVLDETTIRIENAYSGLIEDWSGDTMALSGLDDMITPLIERTSYVTREDVGAATLEKAVSVLSAVDFYRGYVRLKMAAVNTTDETIIDSAVEVHYDTDMLHLERVEPDSMTLRGDRVALGNIKPGQRKTVAILFDPQICQASHLDGHLSYYDSTGELKYVEMKRRHATVVCPVFFTAKNANKAMLRRLIKEKLHATDLRVYRYPRSLAPYELLLIAKGALGEDLQLVREYITRGPPYEAEVWYYGKTRVRGYEFVIRIGVMEEKGVLEIFAASTAMEPITGLLADFRRELNVAYAEGRTGDQRIEVERDEQVRKAIATRPLKLDLPDEDEVLAEDIAEA